MSDSREMGALPQSPPVETPVAIKEVSPSSPVPVPPEAGSPLNRSKSGGAFDALAETISLPLESRVSEDHIRELTQNAKLMEGDQSTQAMQWFTSPIERQDAADSDVKFIAFQTGGFFAVRVFSHVYRFDVVTTIMEVLICAVFLAVLWLVLGTAMEPGGAVFAAVLTILVGTLVGNVITTITGVPPLVGMLLAGMLYANLPGAPARGMSDGFYKFLRNVAVAIILARAGLTFKWKLTKPVLFNVVFTSMVPQLLEVAAHSLIAYHLFSDTYPTFMFALYQGAAIAACSTAVVIPGVSGLQERGYSVTRGPGVLMLCSIAFDAVFAVLTTSFVFELVFPEHAEANLSVGYRLLTAPAQIIAGAIAGVIQGLICLAIFNAFHNRIAITAQLKQDTAEKAARIKCLILSSCMGVGTIFASYKIGFPGSGTVAVVCCAGTMAFVWGKKPETDKRRQLLYKDTAFLWDSFTMPCLFTVVGSSIDAKIFVDPTMLPLMLCCIFGGLAVKMVGCLIVSSGTGYSWKEKVFMALGWCAKSTVQAATAGKVIVHVNDLIHEGWAEGNPDRQAFLQAALKAGELTNTIVVSSILICAVAAGVAMKALGPHLLVKEQGVVLSGGH